MRKELTFLILGAIFLASCSADPGPDDVIISNDFENYVGWGCDNPSVTKEKAYSGKYAVKIDNGIEYGLGFAEALGKVTSRKPAVILVECYALLAKGSKGTLVVSIGAQGAAESTLWEGIALHREASHLDQWVKISKKLTVPEAVQFSDRISCHLWRAEGTNAPTYIDDLKITILE